MSHSIYQWLSLVGIIWLQSFNGTNTDFPAYSSQLKKLLSISQFQLNSLAFASDAGKLLGWFSGVAANYLPLPVVLIIGATLGLIGYGVQFLYVVQKTSHLSYVHIFLLNVLAGNSICWINTVCYTSIIKNFPVDPQVAVGLATSYVGLSAKIYTDIVDVISSSNDATAKAKNYLLLNSILPLIVSLVTAPILFKDVVSNNKENNGNILQIGFTIMFLVTIVTGVYSVIGSLGWKNVVQSPLLYAFGLSVLLIVVPLMIPVGVKIGKFLLKWWRTMKESKIFNLSMMEDHQSANSTQESNPDVDVEMNELKEVIAQDSISSGFSGHDSGFRVQGPVEPISTSKEDIGVKVMVRRVEFWLYFFVYMFGGTLGLVFMNNLGQIAESRGQSSATTSSLVSLSSAFCFFGRLLPSLVHHFSGDKYMISTTTSIATLMTPISATFYLLAFNSSIVSLYISTVIIGLCIGSFTSISVSATTELFGTKNFSINHNIVVGNIPIGSLVFGTCAALLYEKKKKKSDHMNMMNICMGAECYRTTFIIWGCISLLGTVLAFVLYLRTRKFDQQKQLRI
ncbi:hypothetical protein C5167_014708 [Papaver somniferum]|uniref:Nodulin-like domain-containing protein n=1 Tax=Papaver somniferum TaxID=3469 RepID=A0A4Y7J886_PAPSO|nr:protein NUCLEAR FUSION DEFECTIVE 4-like [Papaver somniferum]RZC55835.1 hypothetical protein C5167_014708 [Papaver somniferum]